MPPETLAAPARFAAAPRVRTAGIAALGTALPSTVVTNEQLAPRFGVDPSWFAQRTGITERRHLAEGERLDALAAQAGQRALDAAGVRADQLDAVLLATSSHDDAFPQAGPLVAGLLGAGQALTWDVGLACTGFVAGLAQAAALIEAHRADRVLLIAADALSRHTDPEDRGTAALFADGAAAALLVPGGALRVAECVIGSDGTQAAALCAPREHGRVSMDGHVVFQHAIARMEQACRDVLERAGLELADIDLVVPHQANGRIISALAARLGLDAEKVVDDVAHRGNTSAATIPLALDRAQREGRVQLGATVLVCAFGAGFAWGAGLLHVDGGAG